MAKLKKIRYQKSSFDILTPTELSKFAERKILVKEEGITQKLGGWIVPIAILLTGTMVFFLGQMAFDFDWGRAINFIPTALETNADSMSNATSYSVELLAAILGIVITVVAIVLQLAAQRYGTRLIDLFLADFINRIFFFFMVGTLMYAVLIVYSLKEGFYPYLALQVLLALTLIEIAALAPYFLYVFKFLTPANLLTALQNANKQTLQDAIYAKDTIALAYLQKEAGLGIEQVTDSALSANSQMDRNLGLMAISQIKEMVLDYIDVKKKLAEEWFFVPEEQFVGISSEFYSEICEKHIWFEAKAFMDMELIYKTAIRTMPDAVSAIALNTRILGMEAIRNEDDDLLDLVVQFYNTFIRLSLNEKNVRAIFNIFYQYRLLAEAIFNYDTSLSSRIFFYFGYYGETCLQQGMFFVMYTAAYDMEAMLVAAYDKKVENIEELLLIFLSLEDKVDRTKDAFAFAGIRKAQIILATNLYSKGANHLVEMIIKDLRVETLEQLLIWRDALMAVVSKKFWEVTDRGVNMEYIDPEQKEYLVKFYDQHILAKPELFQPTIEPEAK
ncbi:MAG: DUF2254 family protein [SAR324 cluster bacterium]|nr:DUF2254 family protein [SAR324 cluster bacterium]